MSTVDFMLSKRQQRMLGALLLNPERQYATNELIAIGGPGVGAGRNALDGFHRAGIVTTSKFGNLVLHSINKANPIYEELRSLCVKTFGLADVIHEELGRFRDRIQLAFLFGSIVRGNERPDSDVDLMLVADVDAFELGASIERLQMIFGRKIDLNLYSADEWEKLGSDRVIRAIMKGDRIMLLGEIWH